MSDKNIITKRSLWRYVNLKIKRSIHHYHVFGIITILLDEIIKDLKSGKSVKIINFGDFILRKLPPRKYHNVREKMVKTSSSHNILKFNISKKIRDKMKEYLE